jgi:hypothetical protein
MSNDTKAQKLKSSLKTSTPNDTKAQKLKSQQKTTQKLKTTTKRTKIGRIEPKRVSERLWRPIERIEF